MGSKPVTDHSGYYPPLLQVSNSLESVVLYSIPIEWLQGILHKNVIWK